MLDTSETTSSAPLTGTEKSSLKQFGAPEKISAFPVELDSEDNSEYLPRSFFFFLSAKGLEIGCDCAEELLFSGYISSSPDSPALGFSTVSDSS